MVVCVCKGTSTGSRIIPGSREQATISMDEAQPIFRFWSRASASNNLLVRGSNIKHHQTLLKPSNKKNINVLQEGLWAHCSNIGTLTTSIQSPCKKSRFVVDSFSSWGQMFYPHPQTAVSIVYQNLFKPQSTNKKQPTRVLKILSLPLNLPQHTLPVSSSSIFPPLPLILPALRCALSAKVREVSVSSEAGRMDSHGKKVIWSLRSKWEGSGSKVKPQAGPQTMNGFWSIFPSNT